MVEVDSGQQLTKLVMITDAVLNTVNCFSYTKMHTVLCCTVHYSIVCTVLHTAIMLCACVEIHSLH